VEAPPPISVYFTKVSMDDGTGESPDNYPQGFTSTVFVTSKIFVPLTPVPQVPQYGPKSPVVQPDPAPSPPPQFTPDDNQKNSQPTTFSPNGNPSNSNNNDDQNGNDQDGDSENNDKQDDEKQEDEKQEDEKQDDKTEDDKKHDKEKQDKEEYAAIIVSAISEPWKVRPAPTQAADNGNPSTPENPGPINPGAIISNVFRLTKAPAATPLAGQPGHPGQAGQAGQQGQPDQYIPILIGPSDVVIGNQVVPMPSASEQPKVVVVNGESFTVAATEVIGRYTTVPFPVVGGFIGASPTTIVVAGVPVIVVGTSQAIISGQTYSIGPSANPTTVVVNGQTIRIGSAGVGFASTTLTGSAFTRTAVGGVNVGLGASQVVISGSTYNIGPSATPTTIVVNGQTVSIGPGGVGFASITLQGTSFTSTAVAGVTFGVGASQVVVSGTTYSIGPSAIPTTIVVNGQTISIGPGGVGFASTTIHGSSLTTTAVGAVTFAIGASQVVISGTTYNIGPSATPTTIVIDGQTISIGPSGLGFASTTISPATGGATTTASNISNAAQRTSPLPSRTAAEAQSPSLSSGGAASPSPNTLLGSFSAFLLATFMGLTILL
jgi:hypothetical protein